MALVSVFGNTVTFRSGWKIGQVIIDDEKQKSIELERKLRKYERFNEVINELITMEIREKFKNICGGVFSNQNSEDNLLCGYLEQEYIVKDFFETYKKRNH